MREAGFADHRHDNTGREWPSTTDEPLAVRRAVLRPHRRCAAPLPGRTSRSATPAAKSSPCRKPGSQRPRRKRSLFRVIARSRVVNAARKPARSAARATSVIGAAVRIRQEIQPRPGGCGELVAAVYEGVFQSGCGETSSAPDAASCGSRWSFQPRPALESRRRPWALRRTRAEVAGSARRAVNPVRPWPVPSACSLRRQASGACTRNRSHGCSAREGSTSKIPSDAVRVQRERMSRARAALAAPAASSVDVMHGRHRT